MDSEWIIETSGYLFERRTDSMENLKSHGYALLQLREEYSMQLEDSQTADLVFVLSKQKRPLMPCRPSRARKLLDQGKAKVVRKNPFTIQLLFGSTGYLQELMAGMDTGSQTLGCAATTQGRVIYQAEVALRSDVSSKMQQRAMYRKTRRSRKTRYRPARFDNREKEGKLAPSHQSKVQSHFREKKFVESILPVSKWKVELAQFDIHKISDPQVSKKQGWTYQNGNQKDFYNLRVYILSRDQYTCQQCKKRNQIPLHVHHIVFKSEGGTDTPDNLITLCQPCHTQLHEGVLGGGDQISEKLKKKISSKTKHATEINIVQSRLKKSNWNFEETFGFETKYKREQTLKLPKTHVFDAIAICANDNEKLQPTAAIFFKKHVSKGDYQQTSGIRSEKKIPTGKLFGIKKFDSIETPQGKGFVQGKRSSGYFALTRLDGTKVHSSANVKKDCKRISARTTTLLEKVNPGFLLAMNGEVSAAWRI